MKTKTKKVLSTFLFGLSVLFGYSQADSIKVEYSQEKLTGDDRLNEVICDILTRREKREKDLWKFDVIGTFLGGFNMSYERKIRPEWSYNIQSGTNFSIVTSEEGNQPVDLWNRVSNQKGFFVFSQNINFQLRYYYNLNRRSGLGKKTGFSANYVGLAEDNHFVFLRSRLNVGLLFNSGDFIYGIQRKIGKVGYIDASAGIGFGTEYLKIITVGRNSGSPFVSIMSKLGVGIAF